MFRNYPFFLLFAIKREPEVLAGARRKMERHATHELTLIAAQQSPAEKASPLQKPRAMDRNAPLFKAKGEDQAQEGSIFYTSSRGYGALH